MLLLIFMPIEKYLLNECMQFLVSYSMSIGRKALNRCFRYFSQRIQICTTLSFCWYVSHVLIPGGCVGYVFKCLPQCYSKCALSINKDIADGAVMIRWYIALLGNSIADNKCHIASVGIHTTKSTRAYNNYLLSSARMTTNFGRLTFFSMYFSALFRITFAQHDNIKLQFLKHFFIFSIIRTKMIQYDDNIFVTYGSWLWMMMVGATDQNYNSLWHEIRSSVVSSLQQQHPFGCH